MNDSFFIVNKLHVIDKGSITLWSFKHEYPYLVYRTMSGEIRVNTCFKELDLNTYECCKWYDRHLSDNVKEYEKISPEYFESQVYGSWMDGAR